MNNCENCCHAKVCSKGMKWTVNNSEQCPLFEKERPHGEWVKGREISRTMLCDKTLCIDYENFTCSVCGLVLDRLLYNVDGSPFYKFCPYCGAKMNIAEED